MYSRIGLNQPGIKILSRMEIWAQLAAKTNPKLGPETFQAAMEKLAGDTALAEICSLNPNPDFVETVIHVQDLLNIKIAGYNWEIDMPLNLPRPSPNRSDHLMLMAKEGEIELPLPLLYKTIDFSQSPVGRYKISLTAGGQKISFSDFMEREWESKPETLTQLFAFLPLPKPGEEFETLFYFNLFLSKSESDFHALFMQTDNVLPNFGQALMPGENILFDGESYFKASAASAPREESGHLGISGKMLLIISPVEIAGEHEPIKPAPTAVSQPFSPNLRGVEGTNVQIESGPPAPIAYRQYRSVTTLKGVAPALLDINLLGLGSNNILSPEQILQFIKQSRHLIQSGPSPDF